MSRLVILLPHAFQYIYSQFTIYQDVPLLKRTLIATKKQIRFKMPLIRDFIFYKPTKIVPIFAIKITIK